MELLLAAGLGFLHGLEPDHLAAVSLLTVRGQVVRRSALIGLRFALGHVVVLGIAASIAAGLQVVMTPAAATAAEIVSGSVLALLGFYYLFGRASSIYVHSHTHRHGDEDVHSHLHVHRRGDEHGHSHLSLALGGLFALGGARAAVLVGIPALNSGSPMMAVLSVLAFGAGIVLSMSLAGIVVSHTTGFLAAKGERASRWVHGIVGLAAVGMGVFWVVRGIAS